MKDCKDCPYFSPGDTGYPDYCYADGTEFVEPYDGWSPDWCPLEDMSSTEEEYK